MGKITKIEQYSLKFITTTSPRLVFDRIENLLGKHIESIEAFSDSDVSFDPDGSTVVANDIFKKGYLVIAMRNKEFINRIPLTGLRRALNNGVIRMVDCEDIDWQKSYVQFGNTTGFTANHVVLFAFTYRDMTEAEKLHKN